MLRRLIPTLAVVVVTMVLTSLFQPLSYLRALAQPDSCRAFPQTGRIVCGKFLAFWEKNGGLPAFGYPITNVFRAVSATDDEVYDMQYFQRAVFELHPENDPPHDVQLAHAGAFQFNSLYPEGNVKATYPMYPAGHTFKFEQRDSGSSLVFVTSFQTPDAPETVIAYFRREMLNQGWRLSSQMPPPTISFEYRDPWDDPSCAPDSPNRNPFIPCVTVYNLDLEIARSGSTTSVVQTLHYSTFCCLAARSD
ncbi:MAG: hypothetical protein M3441_13395 [Chloroflexota bacterium]|nr:hypothetical protein [Chloroflexota bacterium]